MSGKFVRASKYRHVFGQSVKRDLCYENLKVTINAWDSNLIKTNGKYISVNWNASGGGAFAIIPVGEVGKAPDQVPLFRGHTAQILDTDFDPFNDQYVASASDDARIGIWKIPEDYSFHECQDEDGLVEDVVPEKFLLGHTRKVGHVLYHPTARHILASSSLDYTVRIWNVDTGENVITLKHPDMVTSMSFSYNGDHLATVSRDKKIRVWDIRKNEIVSEGNGHSGPKSQRIVWLGNSNRLATTGFSKLSDRQIGVWDAFNLENGNLGGFYNVDQSSGILMPFYDDSNKILYVAGKGDGNIRYFEFQDDELFELSEYQSIDPQRGFAIAPKKSVHVKDNEVMRAYKTVRDQSIEPISFVVPRKAEVFQDDIYPDAPSGKPALTAEEWLSGKSVEGPILFSVQSLYDGSKPVYSPAERPIESPISNRDSSPKYESSPTKRTLPNKIVSPKTIPPLSEKPPLDAVFKSSQSVDKLLQTACELDETNKYNKNAGTTLQAASGTTSGWESDCEDQPTSLSNSATTNAPTATAEHSVPNKKTLSSSPQQATSQKSKPSKEFSQTSSVTFTPKTTTSNPSQPEDNPETKPQPESQLATTPRAATKLLSLKQPVEKLYELVSHLESIIDSYEKGAQERDRRLAALETKMEEFLSKNRDT